LFLLTYIVQRPSHKYQQKPVMQGNKAGICLVRSAIFLILRQLNRTGQKKTGLSPGELNREVSRLEDVG
jgi:hypothetical protein